MAQPLYTMPPMPPHLKYKATISTYMDHYRRPVQIRRRTKQFFVPKSLENMMEHQRQQVAMRKPPPPTLSISKVLKRRPQKAPAANTNDVSGTGLAAYDARTEVPYKPPASATKKCDAECIKKIASDGIKARDEARKDKSVNFYDNKQEKSFLAAKSHEGKQSKSTDALGHWLTWNTGKLEEPGLQRRLHRPYPTPEPPVDGTRPKSAPTKEVLISAEEFKKSTPVISARPQQHWMAWNSGSLPPPGVQMRLHRPYPTPEPPVVRQPSTLSCISRKPVISCLKPKVNEKPFSPGSRGVPFNTNHPMPYFV